MLVAPNSCRTDNNHWSTAFCCNGFLLVAMDVNTRLITVEGCTFSPISDKRENTSFESAFSWIYSSSKHNEHTLLRTQGIISPAQRGPIPHDDTTTIIASNPDRMMFTFAALQLFVNTRQYIINASEYVDSFSALSLKNSFISSKISTLSFHFDASWIVCTFFEKSGITDSNYMSHAANTATAIIALSFV